MKIGEIKACQDCKYLRYCGGGCRVEAANIIDKDEYICDNYKIFSSEIVPLLKKLGINEVV